MKQWLTGWLVEALRWTAGIVVKCSKRSPSLCAPLQPSGWQVKTFAINSRYTPDADLDPETGTPVGDEGYYLYILNEAANWDYSGHRILLLSIWQRPWGHSWLMLEKPGERLEFGHSGDLEITADEWAQKLGTITYEITCQIASRVTRIYDPS